MKFRLGVVLLTAAGFAPAAWAQSLVPDGAVATANQHQPLEVVQYSGSVCYLVTFEGGGHLNQIHPETGGLVPGTPIRFAPNWITLTHGVYANNPTVPTIAVYVGLNGAIAFDKPVAEVSFHYASTAPVHLEALDSGGNMVASASGPENIQPDGFSLWEPLSLALGADLITSIRVVGSSGATGLDDFRACQESHELIEVEIDLHPYSFPNETDPYNTNSGRPVDLGVFSTLEFDATTIDPATAFLRDPELSGLVLAQATIAEDLNGDGLPDLVINFGVARDFDEAGALDSNSTSVKLTAFTFSGDLVVGEDSIKIVGN